MTTGLGDQTKQLLARLSSLMWPEAVRERVRAACTLEPPAPDSKPARGERLVEHAPEVGSIRASAGACVPKC